MEHPEHAPAPPPRRTATRRAILIGSASLAAAGSAAAVVGVAARSGEQKVTIPMLAVSGTTGATPSSGPAAVANAPVADPRKRAAHLLRRAGFGGSPAEIEAFAKLSRDEAADRLLNFGATANTTLDARLQAAKFELSDFGNGLMRDMQRWWFTRMAYTARPLEERMAFLWHGLLTSQLSKIGREHAKLMVKQNELFRAMALPKYGDLLQAVSKDPAMLTYLDNVESSKEHPNENYARELMELFSMGVGNYSEDDIRESARAFTGWRITAPERRPRVEGLTPAEQQQIRREAIAAWNPEFRFAVRQHDNGAKTFLGRTGAWDGDDIINIVMEQPATGRFISTRLFEEFAYPGPATETVDRLVQTWDSSGHDIGAVVRAILVSDEFYSEEAYRGKVRSPVEFIVGLVRGLEMEFDTAGLGVAGGARRDAYSPYLAMDQVLFEPPNVAGWPGGASWLSSTTFFARANFLDQFFWRRNGKAIAIPALTGLTTAEDLAEAVATRLIDGDLAPSTREAIVAHAHAITDPAERAATVAYLVAGSPEYQLV